MQRELERVITNELFCKECQHYLPRNAFHSRRSRKDCRMLTEETTWRLQSLLTIYDTSVSLITEIEENLLDISDKQVKEIQSTQVIASKEIDERSKLTNWKKIMIVLAKKAGNLAKNYYAKLNGIDKKHITNNIYPKESPTELHTKNRHHEYVSWFKYIYIKLGAKNTLWYLKVVWFSDRTRKTWFGISATCGYKW